MDRDLEVRLTAFAWLKSQVATFGDLLPLDALRRGFEFQGERVPLVGPQGIFKPRVIPEIPLSITTTPNSPYDDSFDRDGLLWYRYRGTDPLHWENVGLRLAMRRQVPLVYFHGVVPGQYLAVWFRERVLRAYRERCALCHLKHRELLDAAHIVPDTHPEGEPVVTNGLALCKIHHAAFDHYLIGVRPDYVVEVHPRILAESDGPMLRHGLQGMHDTRIELPGSRRDYPDPERLRDRYEKFRGAA